MSCSCRMAPLRTFIRGLAQVHRLDASSPSLRLAAPRATVTTDHLIAAHQARPIHGSRQLDQQDGIAPSASSQHEAPGGLSGDSADTSNAAAASSSPADHGETTPAKPRRGRPRKSNPSTEDADINPEKRNQVSKLRGKAGTLSWRPSRDQNDPRPGNRRQPRGGKALEEAHGGPDGDEPPQQKEGWRIQKEALKAKYPEGWKPRKRLSPDALAGIRALNAQFPDIYTSKALSEKFEVSPENIRRILKSKWQPSVEEEQERQERWHRRGLHVWERKAALGIKAPKKWREEGITRGPEQHERRRYAIQKQREWEDEEREKYRTHRARLYNTGRGKVL